MYKARRHLEKCQICQKVAAAFKSGTQKWDADAFHYREKLREASDR